MRPDAVLQALHGWQNYYTLLGEVSATLTGLMFIAASLGTRLIDGSSSPKVQTFMTPTVVYFSLVLLLSALMNVPVQTRLSLLVQFAAVGLFGCGYSLSHLPRLHRFQHEGILDGPVWIWTIALPFFAAVWLLGAAAACRWSLTDGLDAAVVGVLLFVIIGLHNAWDVTLRMVRLTPNG